MKEPESDNEEVLGGTASGRHHAEVRVRGKEAVGMSGKDIRDSEELQSQKQKSVSEKYRPDAERQDEGRENETFKHDTEFHEFRTGHGGARTTQFSQ